MSAAVLLLLFNRPNTTAQVFAAIREAKPQRLYVAADGPRPDRDGEAERCAEARRIATEVDWPCEVRTLFRDENLGCRQAVSGAITWFFENEEEGIILEDDTLPHRDFFPFCDHMLNRYRNCHKVMAVCGGGYVPTDQRGASSYWFSHVFDPWGWATWRRSWNCYCDDISPFPELLASGRMRRALPSIPEAEQFWESRFSATATGRVSSWAYRWTYSIFLRQGLVVFPMANLICNLGFGNGSTHTTNAESPLANLPLEGLSIPYTGPKKPRVSRRLEREFYVHRLGVPWIPLHVKVKHSLRVLLVGAIGPSRFQRLSMFRKRVRSLGIAKVTNDRAREQ